MPVATRSVVSKRPLNWVSASRLARPEAAFFIFALFVLVSSLITGCASKGSIDDVNLPYTTVKTIVISALPGGLGEQSSNGRTLKSGYFAVARGDVFRSLLSSEVDSLPERGYAKVVILGERRPFRLDIRAFRQYRDRSTKKYVGDTFDKALTVDLVKRIREALANRREDRNVIDDFRAF